MIVSAKLWGHIQRPWGYEIRVNFSDELGQVFNEVLGFPKEPTIEEIETELKKVQSFVENSLVLEKTMVKKPTYEELEAAVKLLEDKINILEAKAK